ncbi:hypothetical protein RHMOL_Rhmol02G0295800 [Rhododendron molle]|uniref:Uncharacterized protein n=1 Tax=Rhododendron molle TaxID=49168 RepID=A0ACC0PYR0_RHOML|nr:hypothetical protein RHMOL_Rhmol02G0295800 [Rhododendron molle]
MKNSTASILCEAQTCKARRSATAAMRNVLTTEGVNVEPAAMLTPAASAAAADIETPPLRLLKLHLPPLSGLAVMDALYFDITVYFRGNVSRIKNVNPGRYTYVDLLDDVAEKSLSTIPCGNGCTITLKSKIPESNETIVVSCDLDVLDMFRFNSRTCQIELIVDVGEDGGTLEVGGQEGVRNDVMAHDVIDLSHMKRSQTLRCTNCKEFGHNRRTCQRAPVKKKKGANNKGQGDQATQGQASQSEIPSQCVTQTESAVMTFTGSNEHAGSRGRGRTNGRGRGRGRNTSVTQNEGGRGSNENAGTRGRGRTNARGRGGRTDVGRGRGTSVSRGKGTSVSRGRGRSGSSEYAQF